MRLFGVRFIFVENKWKMIHYIGDSIIIAGADYSFIRGKATFEDHIYLWGAWFRNRVYTS